MTKLLVIMTAVAGLSACALPATDTETTATATTGTTGTTGTSSTTATCDKLMINQVSVPDCTDNIWTYDVITSCWAGMVEVSTTQNTSSPWEEFHTLDSIERFTLEEQFGLTLPVTDDWSAQASNVNSLYKCDDVEHGRSNTMTWTFDLYDTDGFWVECVAMGADAAASADCFNANDW
jgi:hypothetical protein